MKKKETRKEGRKEEAIWQGKAPLGLLHHAAT
jgi:hypothetical protein